MQFPKVRRLKSVNDMENNLTVKREMQPLSSERLKIVPQLNKGMNNLDCYTIIKDRIDLKYFSKISNR